MSNIPVSEPGAASAGTPAATPAAASEAPAATESTGFKEYESVTVLHPTVTEQELEAEIKAVEELITNGGGRVIEIERWGRRRLAYEIRKVHDGIYTLVRFEAPGAVLTELDRRYRLNERLLRHLTVLSEGPVARMPEGREAEEMGGRRDSYRDGYRGDGYRGDGYRGDGYRGDRGSHLGREAIIED